LAAIDSQDDKKPAQKYKPPTVQVLQNTPILGV
jgi:hypothetical protein